MHSFAIRDHEQGGLVYLLCLFASAILTFSISSQSLWIDEGITVWFASQQSLEGIFSEFIRVKHAESLMPGYILYLWMWIKWVGATEYVLRLSNAPFIIAALLVFAKLPLRKSFKISILLITCFSPFLWFYMDEVRSYITLFSFSSMELSGLVFYFHGCLKWRRIGPHLTVTSLFFGSFFNMSCVFTVPALIVTGYLFYKKTKIDKQKLLRDWTKPILFSIPFFILLGIYYSWMISEGLGGGRLQQHVIPDIRHVAFAFYEFLGFMGLGPPRNILRVTSSLTSWKPYLILVVPAASLFASFGIYILFVFRKFILFSLFDNVYLWGFLSGFLSFCFFAFLTGFLFYGRHLIFIYPYLIFALAYITNEVWVRRITLQLGNFMVVGLLFFLLISDIRIRFHSEYLKDDYRSAAKTAVHISKGNAPIFWAANFHTGAYYGLFYSNIDSQIMNISPTRNKIQKAFFASNWSLELIKKEIENLESAVLVLSKPDLFDVRGGWRSFIKQHKPAEIIDFSVFCIYKFNFVLRNSKYPFHEPSSSKTSLH